MQERCEKIVLLHFNDRRNKKKHLLFTGCYYIYCFLHVPQNISLVDFRVGNDHRKAEKYYVYVDKEGEIWVHVP